MRKTQKSIRSISKYLPILIILLSITIIVGSTFAYFTDRKEDTSNLTFSKVELSSETTLGVDGAIHDVIPGSKLIDGEVAFSKAIDSEAIYVRAKVSFSLPSEYKDDVDMQGLLDKLRSATNFNIESSEQAGGAVWSAKDGNYFYLVTKDDATKLMRVDTIDTYVLSSDMVVPRDLEQLDGNAQYMKSINFHIAFEAIQADNVSDNLADTKEVFDELFPEGNNEKIKYTVKQYNNNGEEEIINSYSRGEEILEPEVVKTGYKLDGWYTLDGTESGNWGDKVVFPLMVNENIQLYAKWVSDSKLLVVKQIGIGANATLTKVGKNAELALSKGAEDNIFSVDEYTLNARVYKDIEIRAYKVGTNEVVAVLDKDGDDTNNIGNVMTATAFPWSGVYDNGTSDVGDDINVDIYTYYPTHYIGYIPDGNDNFYIVLSDEELVGEIEVEDGVMVTVTSNNVKKIDAYNRSTFEPVYETESGYLTSAPLGTGAITPAIRLRSVAGQFVGTCGKLADYRDKLTVMEAVEGVTANYILDDYRMFDYDMLYMIKYADFDSQTAVGRGIVDNVNTIKDLATYQSGVATVEGWAVTPNLANCIALAGRDGYVGVNGKTPLWCLGISNPWGNTSKYQEGVFNGSKNIYYSEDESKYTSESSLTSSFKKYTTVYTSASALNSRADIYGSNVGQVDNPLMAFFINNNRSYDKLNLNTSSLSLTWRYGCYRDTTNAGISYNSYGQISPSGYFQQAGVRLLFVAN